LQQEEARMERSRQHQRRSGGEPHGARVSADEPETPRAPLVPDSEVETDRSELPPTIRPPKRARAAPSTSDRDTAPTPSVNDLERRPSK
jgi:hypothetical protein